MNHPKILIFPAGTHGMGQAQSQFSSGDCSGCGYQPDYPSSGRIIDASGTGAIGGPGSNVNLPGKGKKSISNIFNIFNIL